MTNLTNRSKKEKANKQKASTSASFICWNVERKINDSAPIDSEHFNY